MKIFQFFHHSRFSENIMKIAESVILLCFVSSSVGILFSNPCPSCVVYNVRDNCLCPQPNNGYQVADFLNKQISDLERVVVFYYRDKTNNEVYMYTPCNDKQLAIPELQYDAEDDIEKIDSQVSLSLFGNSPANTLSQTYQYPNQDMYQYDQHTKPRLTQLSKFDYYSPKTSHYRKTWHNRLRPDKSKSNDEADNGVDIYPHSPRDKKKSAIRIKKLNSQNKQITGNNADYTQALNVNSYDFNTWYSQSVIQFPEIYSGDLKYITFIDLREQLLRIFNEHGYSVINSQVLDPQGEAVESSNYKLVRVKIKQDNDEKRLSSEIEGIMFIKLVPMTILGVVPLTNNIEESNSNETEISDERGGGKDELHTEAKVYTGSAIAQASGNKEGVITETSETSSDTKQRPLDVLLRNLVRAVNRLVPHRRESNVDVPGYRIIGGNAATGSGAPISSKGRSGTPH